ncbi:MAG: homoserine O-succinyltransferase [Coxiellaceae bacterium]|nr:homoserine O-succinyltransferase [Coxiellaceae bacterium]
MKLNILSHASFEALGSITDWIDHHGYQMDTCCPYKGDAVAAVDSFDGLIIMGGPQSVIELEKYPYLQAEMDLILQAIAANKPILGVCLGAQLISAALGAVTEKSPDHEVGFFTTELNSAGKQSPLLADLPPSFISGQWHYDMPGVPVNAQVLASSAGCPRQIIQYGERVLGMQCHLELTQAETEVFIAKCPQDLAPGKYVQTPDQMLATDFALMASQMHAILNRLFVS